MQYGPYFARYITLFQCDNRGLIAAITKGSFKEKTVLHGLLIITEDMHLIKLNYHLMSHGDSHEMLLYCMFVIIFYCLLYWALLKTSLLTNTVFPSNH